MILPQAFINSINEIISNDAHSYFDALNTPSPISIRFNPKKWKHDVSLTPVKWAKNAYYLNERPSFTLDPIFHAGYYYVQEASSMLIEEVLKQVVDLTKTLKVLDLCAAPGGKSTILRSLLSDESLLICNETVPNRARLLSDNLKKWGHPSVAVTRNDPSSFSNIHEYFDVIVVDAPCSGEGLFRKNTDAINEWSEENVKLCASRQTRILSEIQQCLKPNGILIYSTCTHNTLENEQVINEFTENFPFKCLKIDTLNKFSIDTRWYKNAIINRAWPHKLTGEGFSFSVLQKLSTDEPIRKRKNQSKNYFSKANPSERSLASQLINAKFEIVKNQNGELFMVPDLALEFYNDYSEFLTFIQVGTKIGTIDKHGLSPAIDLFLSSFGNVSYAKQDIELTEALFFLKKQLGKIKQTTPGFTSLIYEGMQIGGGKNIGNRFNGYWPSEWMIQMNLPSNLPLPFWTIVKR